MPYLIRILADDGGDAAPSPVWLRALDVDAHHGRGDVRTTMTKAHALRFASIGAAFAEWTRTSTAHPLRPDGKPNRPLTAYTITFDQVEE